MHIYALIGRGAILSQDFAIFLVPPSDASMLLSLDSACVVYNLSMNYVISVSYFLNESLITTKRMAF